MDIITLPNNEALGSGFSHAFKITHEDLTETTVATAQEFTLIARPAGSYLARLATRLVTAFSDASDAAFNDCAITVGDGSTADLFLASQQLNANGTEVFAKIGQGVPAVVNAASTAGTIKLTFNSMAAKALADLDAGEVWIFIQLVDVDQLV
jgi:hypothetical protein